MLQLIKNLLSPCLSVLALAVMVPSGWAVTPADQLLPDTTCVFISFPSMESLRKSFDTTRLGELVKDPVMKPFAEDIGGQLRDRLADTEVQLGLKWEDLDGVYGGEACIARIQPGGVVGQHATALLLDVTGHLDDLAKVRQDLGANMQKQKATKSVQVVAGTEITIYQFPKKLGTLKGREVFSFLSANQFVITNHAEVATQILRRMSANLPGNLKQSKNYSHVMAEVSKQSGELAPHIRWFVDPFQLADVVRAAHSTRSVRRGKNIVQILKNQGFDAIRAAGGHINLATEDHELLHRTFVYAPAVQPNADKFNKAAKMLSFPSRKLLPVETWVPRKLATYMTFNWNLSDAFEHSIGMIDEVVDSPGFVEDVLKSFETDKTGPQINLRSGLLAHLDEKIVTFSDNAVPISTKSERLLVGVKVKDATAVEGALAKLWKNDPQAKKRTIEGKTVWEIIPEEEDALELELPNAVPIPGASISVADDSTPDEEAIKLPNTAMTVAHDYLIVSTDIALLTEILAKRPVHNSLGESADFIVVNQALADLGGGEGSFQFFSRTDEEYHLAYEMIRQGKMPQSESVLGRVLNRLLGPEEEDVMRDPKLDGSKLPPYQTVRRYLGPSGTFVKPLPDGWLVVGLMLDKQKLVQKSAATRAALTAKD